MDFGEIVQERIHTINFIEIVPKYLLPSGQEWCIVDGVLGIADKFLIKSFLAMCPLDPRRLTTAQSLLALLATTENITAANARKRQCLSHEIDPQDELHINTVMLQSHLYKHCKSSVLWFHRRWLLETFQLDTSLDGEWSVVAQAAQHHPKNYYAWGHLRWYYHRLGASAKTDSHKRLVNNLTELCRQNVGDVSMWSFLHWLDDPDLHRFAGEINATFPGHDAVLGGVRPHSGSNTRSPLR